MHSIPNKYIIISILNILVVPGQRSVGNMVLQNGFDYFERFGFRKGIQLSNFFFNDKQKLQKL